MFTLTVIPWSGYLKAHTIDETRVFSAENLVYVLGCPVHAVTAKQTLRIVEGFIESRKPHQHVVVNAAKIVNMRDDRDLFNDVVNANLINADGMSVVWASKIIGSPVPERVTGIDLMETLVAEAAVRNWGLYFLGAREEIVKKVVTVYSERYPGLKIAGWRDGYFSDEQEREVVTAIRDSRADILFVAMTSPKKERFLAKWKIELGVPFQMGVGGSFDVVAGKTGRAPNWMQQAGLEWLFRLLQEPGRMWKRYLTTNTRFAVLLFRAYIAKLFSSK